MNDLAQPQGIPLLRFAPNPFVLIIIGGQIAGIRLNPVFVDEEDVANPAPVAGAAILDPVDRRAAVELRVTKIFGDHLCRHVVGGRSSSSCRDASLGSNESLEFFAASQHRTDLVAVGLAPNFFSVI